MKASMTDSLVPSELEPVCLVSFEIARIRLGGGPDSRPSFWKAYREELALNLRTEYQNSHVQICRTQLKSLGDKLGRKAFFRRGNIVFERHIDVPNSDSGPSLIPV
jgi:hypothetical protein